MDRRVQHLLQPSHVITFFIPALHRASRVGPELPTLLPFLFPSLCFSKIPSHFTPTPLPFNYVLVISLRATFTTPMGDHPFLNEPGAQSVALRAGREIAYGSVCPNHLGINNAGFFKSFRLQEWFPKRLNIRLTLQKFDYNPKCLTQLPDSLVQLTVSGRHGKRKALRGCTGFVSAFFYTIIVWPS